MSLIVDDFLFLNIYVLYKLYNNYIYFLSNSGQHAIHYPAIAFLGSAAIRDWQLWHEDGGESIWAIG